MRKLLITTAFAFIASPALAQFPPPGIYLCIDSTGAPIGTLSLFVAGDYQWAAEDGTGGKGQITSAGNTVEALTGPMADLNAKGTFATDGFGETKFALTSSKGDLRCGLPPE